MRKDKTICSKNLPEKKKKEFKTENQYFFSF